MLTVPFSARCECPDVSINHDEERCDQAPAYIVVRDGKQLMVCAECILSDDRQLDRVRRATAPSPEAVEKIARQFEAQDDYSRVMPLYARYRC